ncbi:hypothetical protein V5O48_009353 [Marasmius crinis-equi]|uniref:Uncharacterized protein n=1 Tax=Marasmius crinis-equi TaxID=585013 RepID=A0ABR3FBP3_9AGAR
MLKNENIFQHVPATLGVPGKSSQHTPTRFSKGKKNKEMAAGGSNSTIPPGSVGPLSSPMTKSMSRIPRLKGRILNPATTKSTLTATTPKQSQRQSSVEKASVPPVLAPTSGVKGELASSRGAPASLLKPIKTASLTSRTTGGAGRSSASNTEGNPWTALSHRQTKLARAPSSILNGPTSSSSQTADLECEMKRLREGIERLRRIVGTSDSSSATLQDESH